MQRRRVRRDRADDEVPEQVHRLEDLSPMADLGRAALVVSFGLALYALVGGTAAAITRQRRLADSARNALIACFGSTVIASAVLVRALVHARLHLRLRRRAHEPRPAADLLADRVLGRGGGLAAPLAARPHRLRRARGHAQPQAAEGHRRLGRARDRRASRPSSASCSSRSRARSRPQPRVVDGAGLVPSLQNPYMVAHPPMLYLGYVGLSIPFAFAAGAMLSGQTDERWIVATRRWTLAAWMFLGFGQILGAHWAYVEVGWGGYYAWDPVENAALMPWLAATAFLHSVMVQERKGMLRIWNMVLVALAFELSVFGTFLTRSGVIESIHSFAKSSIGGWFLGFVVVTTLFSIALILWRLPLLRARTKLESPLSREATFLYNNLLLVALCLTILWGEIFPILTQLWSGDAADDRAAVLRLLPAHLRAAAAAADGDRAADRLAADLRAGAAEDAPLADRRRARHRRRADRARRRLVAARPDRLHVLRLRAHDDRRRARPRHARDRLARRSSSRATGAATAATSSTPRSCCSRSGSSARAPTGRPRSSRSRSASRCTSPGYTLTYLSLKNTPKVTESGNSTETTGVPRRCSGRWNGTLTTRYVNSSALGVSHEVGIHTDWLRAEDLYVILDQVVGQHGLLQGAREAARQPDLARGLRLPRRLADRDVARRPRAAPPRRAALARPRVIALILGGLIAVAAVVIVALPFLRDNGEPELIDDGARDRGAAAR